MASQKALIRDIRLGHFDIQDLDDDTVTGLLGYCLPDDVRALCFGDIKRRRDGRLAAKRAKDNATGSGGINIEGSA